MPALAQMQREIMERLIYGETIPIIPQPLLRTPSSLLPQGEQEGDKALKARLPAWDRGLG